MKRIRVIVIDDERLARKEVKHALKAFPDFEVIGEAANADEAKQQIEAANPDLIFLDMQMPEQNGFDLLESLDKVPEVVFITAFDHYAVQAFEISALDYLVKPIRAERFEMAVEKIRKKWAAATNEDKSLSTEHQMFIKDGNKCHFLKLKDVYMIESMDNYATLYYDNKKLTSIGR
jgi:two-component system LytT family response regulator